MSWCGGEAVSLGCGDDDGHGIQWCVGGCWTETNHGDDVI